MEEIDEENLIKTTQVTRTDGTKSVEVWTTARTPKVEARRLEILQSLEEDTGMQAQIAQPEGSPTPNSRKKGRLLEAGDSLLDLTGHASIPPPRMEPLAAPTLVMPPLPIIDEKAIGIQETTIPCSSTDKEDLAMGAPIELDMTLSGSAHALEVLKDQDNQQGDKEDEDMEEEKVEMSPKEPFE